MKVLVLNAGSSSIKYQLFDMRTVAMLLSGAVEKIGEKESLHRVKKISGNQVIQNSFSIPAENHKAALTIIEQSLRENGDISNFSSLQAIGHRVVHGGSRFSEPTAINDQVLQDIRDMVPLAPLHNPANILGIEVARQLAPKVPQVAVFDTAFHQSIPEQAYRYAVADELYSKYQVRRYGFHGTSHHFVARQAAEFLDQPLHTLKLITLHLGNGASATAINKGQSIDTSMGMTPLEGLMMGTRCGDLDPAIIFYLQRNGFEPAEIEKLLNKQSGFFGVCGATDLREVHKLSDSGNRQAKLALEIYSYRIKKYIGAYLAVLGGLDALIFTGGVGENDAWVREHCCNGLQHLGIKIDLQKNTAQAQNTRAINASDSQVALLVVPTNEELEIARQTMQCLALQ